MTTRTGRLRPMVSHGSIAASNARRASGEKAEHAAGDHGEHESHRDARERDGGVDRQLAAAHQPQKHGEDLLGRRQKLRRGGQAGGEPPHRQQRQQRERPVAQPRGRADRRRAASRCARRPAPAAAGGRIAPVACVHGVCQKMPSGSRSMPLVARVPPVRSRISNSALRRTLLFGDGGAAQCRR